VLELTYSANYLTDDVSNSSASFISQRRAKCRALLRLIWLKATQIAGSPSDAVAVAAYVFAA